MIKYEEYQSFNKKQKTRAINMQNSLLQQNVLEIQMKKNYLHLEIRNWQLLSVTEQCKTHHVSSLNRLIKFSKIHKDRNKAQGNFKKKKLTIKDLIT